MREREQILQLWAESEARGDSAVLATVVKTQGSSYRLPGARLLIGSTGKYVGSISGGCLEEDLLKKAWWLTENGPAIRRYDTTSEGEAGPAYGLGCNGVIHVLLERLTPSPLNPISLIGQVYSSRKPSVIGHLLEPSKYVGQRLIAAGDGQIRHNIDWQELAIEVEQACREAIPSGCHEATALQMSGRVRLSGAEEVFVETVVPPVRLLIFGAGHDAVPVCSLARLMGWTVHVFDGRAHQARRERFPDAQQVSVQPAGQLPLETDQWTAALLMSHSYTQDRENLRRLAGEPLAYLGVLGPRRRTERLLEDADLSVDAVHSLHAPVGLDIGADGPHQVALSVIAGIQAALNGRSGGFLRNRKGSIHADEQNAAPRDTLWIQSIVCA